MKYKITNITNGYISLEPPSILRRTDFVIREYTNGKLPARIQYFRDQGMVDVSPVRETGQPVPESIVVSTQEMPAQEMPAQKFLPKISPVEVFKEKFNQDSVEIVDLISLVM